MSQNIFLPNTTETYVYFFDFLNNPQLIHIQQFYHNFIIYNLVNHISIPLMNSHVYIPLTSTYTPQQIIYLNTSQMIMRNHPLNYLMTSNDKIQIYLYSPNNSILYLYYHIYMTLTPYYLLPIHMLMPFLIILNQHPYTSISQISQPQTINS